jgi:cobyrinic acid a,c-diamide synthase
MLPRDESLALPDRHLGLVQAGEHPALDDFLDRAADLLAAHADLEAIYGSARPGATSCGKWTTLPPFGQRIAVARDEAFGFSYASVLESWRMAGAEVSFFSPLADESPARDADAVYLPGGYPELHAGRIADCRRFLDGLRDTVDRGAAVFGECGGYMVLGEGLVDADGCRHGMAGLLPLVTSFANRSLHLGYRKVATAADSPLGARGLNYTGHEFHYATVVEEGPADRLFEAADAKGCGLGPAGLALGRVAGSFIHLIDRAS